MSSSFTSPSVESPKSETVSAPSTANFAIRARLARFDTEDAPSDAKGLIAVRGLSVGLDGAEDETLGRLTIK